MFIEGINCGFDYDSYGVDEQKVNYNFVEGLIFDKCFNSVECSRVVKGWIVFEL